jgi:ribosomal protein S18 acetylase RimI-like enzyme
MTHERLSWRIEDACWNAFPSLQQVLLGDWLLRFGEGLTRRANSVNPLKAHPEDFPAAIAAGEAIYHAHDLPVIFRVPTIVDPAIDRALASLGYPSEGESCVLHGAVVGLNLGAGTPDPAVRLWRSPDPHWLRAMARLQAQTAAQSKVYRRIVGAIAIPARFALLAVDGAPAALAYGAIHEGLLCYESVVTDPTRRRQGLAHRVIASLAGWARDSGATGACLEVEASNAPALALYARFGLGTELYRYHYRREPPQP